MSASQKPKRLDEAPARPAGSARRRRAMNRLIARSSPLARQFATFLSVGLVTFAVHYGMLIALVEGLDWDPVVATLCGFVAGGWVSYTLNRRHTYASARPHAQATWRFVVVATIGFGLTWLLMTLFTRRFGLPYIPAQLATTGVVLFWSFLANKLWTFAGAE